MNENAPNPVPNAVPIQLTIGGAEGFEPPQFQVIAARLTMGISDCFELKLDVQNLDPAIHLGSLLRREVVVQFPEEAHVPELRGIIRRARSVTSEPTGISRYQLRIVPPLWLLHPRRNHRIFPEYAVSEILDCLLGEHGVTDLPSRSKLSDPHPYRAYTVQYGESDLDFVQRLMADEGIVYWFDFKKGKTELVLADDTSEGATALDVRFPFVPLNQLDPNRSAIYAMAPAVDTTWAASTIRDYDYLHPSFEIVGKGAAPPTAGDADLEWYEFEVGEVRTAEEAKKRAADTLASHYNRDRWMVCDSTVLLAPGTKFGIDGSSRPEANGDFLVCWTLSYWDAGKDSGPYQYEHHLTCIPAVNKFKTRRLKKPSIAGVQTGVVVGREGMEIDVDENGEVEVEFKWDRAAHGEWRALRRVRISQGWAGLGYGLVTFPRVGDEVVVAYIDGDPDQPLIVGRVHNPTRPNPLKPEEQKTVSVWRSRSSPGGDGYNEILMDDLAGKERLDVHAQRDFNQVIEHDANITIKHDQSVTVHGDHTAHTVGKGDISYRDGFSFTTPADGKLTAKNLELKAHYLKIDAGDRDDNTDGAYNHTAGAVWMHVAGHHETSCSSFKVWATESIRLQCGGSFIEITPGGITITGAGPVDIKGTPINLNC